MTRNVPIAADESLRLDREVRSLLTAGRLTEANALFDQVLAKPPPELDRWERSAVFADRAVLAWRLRRIPLSLELTAEAWIDLEVETPSGPAAARSLSLLGYMFEGIGHRRAALDVLRLSVATARAADDANALGWCLQRLGGTLNFRAYDLGPPADEPLFLESRGLLAEGLTLDVTEDSVGIALLGAYGAALCGLGQLAEARENATAVLNRSCAEGHRWGEAVGHWVLGHVGRREGRFDVAVDHARKSVQFAEEINDVSLQQRFSADLAALCAQRGDAAGEASALRKEIAARAVAMQTMQEGIGQALEQRRLAIRAQRAATAAQQAAARDPLTGLTNRLGLERVAPQRLARGNHALVLIDVDWFKGVNDAAGHAAGDATLREIAQVLRSQCRAGDLVARWAGDEFVVLLAGADEPSTSAEIAERIRHAVDRHDWTSLLGTAVRPTVSIGVAVGQGELDRLFAAADVALYTAKRGGRNRVEVHSGEPTAPAV
ncbi:GGDEF domain-containing protein [Labedaea rhizosphaerae]|uniref:Diguanylate cyclase (GGDEF)-like protein n=1 Tax=Labedaea rhizosphaerae TaxID=598644 RepID=A0A4R6SKB4_LABRH|nr:GGDEF domain-containing protein [Labedaea rhizosphaerae]TDQ04357.1 diguanylate cyclase (GGDEF)-like protein [Labedaea rhizosphaerae]